MFNILPSAIDIIKILCPEVDIMLSFYPQTQQSHQDDPVPLPTHTLSARGVVQTTTPTQDEVISYTINSPRYYRIYIPSSYEILSHLQRQPSQLTADFTYDSNLTHAVIYGIKDYRYNGWVALLASQALPTIYNPHHGITPDIIF